MLKTWLSRNLRKVIVKIMALFSAIDADMDNYQDALEDLDERVEDIRQFFLDGDVTAVVINDALYDNNGVQLLDSGTESIKSSVIYIKA